MDIVRSILSSYRITSAWPQMLDQLETVCEWIPKIDNPDDSWLFKYSALKLNS
jgi:hypothetical protein